MKRKEMKRKEMKRKEMKRKEKKEKKWFPNAKHRFIAAFGQEEMYLRKRKNKRKINCACVRQRESMED